MTQQFCFWEYKKYLKPNLKEYMHPCLLQHYLQ